MPRKKMTGADHIRTALRENPQAKPSEIVAVLSARGIKVGASNVSTLRKRMSKEATKPTDKLNQIGTTEDILLAVKFVQKVGVVRAKAAVDLVAKIRAITG